MHYRAPSPLELRHWAVVQRRPARDKALVPTHRTDVICSSCSAPFRLEKRRRRQCVRSLELHGETLRAERLAAVFREESEHFVGQRHASRNTFVDVRQASQPAPAFVTLRVLLILIRVILTRSAGTLIFLARHSAHRAALVMTAEQVRRRRRDRSVRPVGMGFLQ